MLTTLVQLGTTLCRFFYAAAVFHHKRAFLRVFEGGAKNVFYKIFNPI